MKNCSHGKKTESKCTWKRIVWFVILVWQFGWTVLSLVYQMFIRINYITFGLRNHIQLLWDELSFITYPVLKWKARLQQNMKHQFSSCRVGTEENYANTLWLKLKYIIKVRVFLNSLFVYNSCTFKVAWISYKFHGMLARLMDRMSSISYDLWTCCIIYKSNLYMITM